MRGTYITMNILDGVPAASLMQTTGHKNYKVFSRYIRYAASESTKVINRGVDAMYWLPEKKQI